MVVEEFEEELAAISALVNAAADPSLGGPRARVAGANAAILLLAATFEEFVRELARSFARAVVEGCDSYDKLPPRLATVAWRRTMESLARLRLNDRTEVFSRESIFADAQTRFTIAYEFCRGDLTQDIYQELIHNESNMRPQELNSLFNLSGLGNVCGLASAEAELLTELGETEPGQAAPRLVERLEDFFERRNQVAHSLNSMRSSGPEQITADIALLSAFGRSVQKVLEREAPRPARDASTPAATLPGRAVDAAVRGIANFLRGFFKPSADPA
nr:HEPN domain-containing protein [Sphingomonas telluris]